jgi:hypothetical protein
MSERPSPPSNEQRSRLSVMQQHSNDEMASGSPARWLHGAAVAYLAALWGSLVVILWSVGSTPTLDANRPGEALALLVLVVMGASFLGRGTAGISGAVAGAASAYALAIITALRAAERNSAFIAPGPAPAWQIEVTEALLWSLVVLGAGASIGALWRQLRDRRRQTRGAPRGPLHPNRLAGPAVVMLIGLVALGGMGALVAAAADTSIVLPAQVPTVTATGRGAIVTVSPASLAPGEVQIVMFSDSADACAACAGGLEFLGPLSDAELVSLQSGAVFEDSFNSLPRPAQLWYGGVSLGQGRYAFVHTATAGPDEPYLLIGVRNLTVSSGPTPPVVSRTSGSAPLFVWIERLVLALNGAALCRALYRRRRIAVLRKTPRRLVTVGLATLTSLALAGGLAFYVSFAGSPF